MSQWNDGYAYNNMYQDPNTWNGDVNNQYSNQAYYPNNHYDSSNQYVSFEEFISQMQNTSIVPQNAANYNNVHYQNYPHGQYNYQNMPSTSQNTQLNTFNYGPNPSNVTNRVETYQVNVQNQYNNVVQDTNPYTNEMVFKSNLTPTATEFVPKSSLVTPSSSTQNLVQPESMFNGDTEVKSKNKPSSSTDTNWRERSQSHNDKSHSNSDTNKRHESNSRSYDSQRNQESSNRNKEHNGRHYENSSRNYESSSNNRSQSKLNPKPKSKDSEPVRTFYNSSIGKGQESRNGRSENSGKYRNSVGSQRLRPNDRNVADDEQFAKTYLQHRDEKTGKSDKAELSSPMRNKKKNDKHEVNQENTELTQRERLSEQLDKGTLECLVCCERVKQTDPVWSCSNCYHVLHLKCVRKWAMSSMVEGKWRCPACQNCNEEVPTEYRCMCSAVRCPEYQRGSSGAHTCGKACKRPRNCPHPCTLLCHPGPCPPCQATISKQCGCGAETRSVLCSSKLPQVCGRVCNRKLDCGVHTCAKDCHEGPCETCTETVTQECHCPALLSRQAACAEARGAARWSCGAACGRVLACGAHVCRAACHAPPCPPCPLLPAAVPTCPCGKTRLDKDQRKSCTDPIPLCGNICAKPLPCGPAGDKHFCKMDCHEGPCPVCPDKTLLQCRCGHSSREVPCADLPQMINNVLCQKKCNKKLSCGRHRCRAACCGAAGAPAAHRCALPCGRALSCQTHRCEEFCHTGHCAPCPRLSFSELSCECGAQVALPPVRCGARPPACSAPCRRRRACGHAPLHACHAGACPPCVVLTAKRCHGGHEERKTIPCSQEEFSCGLPCGKPLPCGKHTCIKICHKGPCDTGKCTQPCNEKRPSCGHACAAPCHWRAGGGGGGGAGAGRGGSSEGPGPVEGARAAGAGDSCPSAAPCRRPVRATCPCGRRSAQRACADNARDLAKIMSALAASKLQEGGTVDISEVQRPGMMLKTLECDEECRMEARARQLALALQIRNPDVSAKLAPRYSEHVRATAAREPTFAQHVHERLTELVQLAKKSKQKTRSHSFPSMNWQKRQFIHELCEHFGCESVAYDAEPNRNVVATADREKSWLPAMSILEVLAREAGKRRVPGPILRAAPTTGSASTSAIASASTLSSNKSSAGWATLTSTNAWAARSQPKPVPQQPLEAKIDYFDNPPEN